MTLILNIETATKNCSVSLADGKNLLLLKEVNDGSYSHGEMLHVYIDEVIKKARKNLNDLDAVAVSKGPGSYTGLRIGVSAAKGLCYSLDVPLISVSTLASLASILKVEKDALIIPLLDARRMEVYSCIYDSDYHQIRGIKAEIITENSFATYLDKGKVYFLGDGANKCKETIIHKNAIFLDNYFPSAKEMVYFSSQKFENKDFEDVAYFEPFYLKDFIAIKSK
ncbi:MAG: tRNA (adenosine(37)-N6)-threonylcarbamoyltransferase complex dimerization subunit type 1 TsaB [Flavobacteriaceae bacterium]|nr:tRNA (adenosine(37)-N6)-threonylcarbamoyltransferase complex dimerization subunit type 1 TsaB [Flavobacteriaceae bacterium]